MRAERTPSPDRVHLIDKGYKDLNPLNCGYHNCLRGHSAVGMRAYYMIHYVDEGMGRLYFDGKEETVKKGQAFIILPYEDARYVADDANPWRYTFICFNGALAEKLKTLHRRVIDLPSEPFDILRKLESREDTREEMATAALHMIFAAIFSGRAPRPRYVERAVNMINTTYFSEALTVSGIADEMGLDRRYLSRIFKDHMGMTVQNYLIRVRMENAKKILKSGAAVSATAALVGYSDNFNFSKMFKKYTGVSPKAYILKNK